MLQNFVRSILTAVPLFFVLSVSVCAQADKDKLYWDSCFITTGQELARFPLTEEFVRTQGGCVRGLNMGWDEVEIVAFKREILWGVIRIRSVGERYRERAERIHLQLRKKGFTRLNFTSTLPQPETLGDYLIVQFTVGDQRTEDQDRPWEACLNKSGSDLAKLSLTSEFVRTHGGCIRGENITVADVKRVLDKLPWKAVHIVNGDRAQITIAERITAVVREKGVPVTFRSVVSPEGKKNEGGLIVMFVLQ